MAFGELFDSAAVARGLGPLWDPAQGLVVGNVRNSSDPEDNGLRLMAEGGDSVHLERLQRVLEEARLEGAEEDTWFRIVLGDEAGLRPRSVAGFQSCAPQLLNRGVIERQLKNLPPAIRDRAGGAGLRAEVWTFVEAGGTVSRVLLQESSGDQAFDQAAVRIVHGLRFRPALIEGIPTGVWTSIPVSLR